MNRRLGVCAGCSTGCTIRIDENQDTVYRLTPQENMFINKWWMCDEGRSSYKHLHQPERPIEPRRFSREGKSDGGERSANIEWSHIPRNLTADLKRACDMADESNGNGGRLAAVVSPNLTVEEAYLLCKLARSFDPGAVLA